MFLKVIFRRKIRLSKVGVQKSNAVEALSKVGVQKSNGFSGKFFMVE